MGLPDDLNFPYGFIEPHVFRKMPPGNFVLMSRQGGPRMPLSSEPSFSVSLLDADALKGVIACREGEGDKIIVKNHEIR
jgi:hypothetical protein